MCGENVYRREMVCLRQGSPPRVRGKQVIERRLFQVVGITPACAGKTGKKRAEALSF